MAESTSTVSTIESNAAQSPALQHESSFKKWAGLGVLSLGLAIVVIDNTLLNVSLSTIIKDLHTDLQSLQWVITAYALVLAAFTITGGRFGDLFGRKKMFMLGAIIFAVGSFLASISKTIPVLLLGESIIEGFGAALMMPATSSLVVANFSGKERATAFGIWGGVAGASSAIGPLLGGYLTSNFSWRWGFRINIFVAAIVVIGSILFLKESRDDRKPTLDWGGVVLSALGLLGVTFGIIESSTLGWWKAKGVLTLFGHAVSFGSLSLAPFAILAGVVILILFFWWEIQVEKKGQSPLVSMKLLQNQQFSSGVITTSILTLGMTGLIFALPVFLQAVKKLDAFHTGLALLPLSLALLVVAPLGGFLSKHVTPKYLIQAGLVLDVIAAFILRATIKSDMPVSHLIPGLALYGLGMGLVFPPISNLVLSAVPVQMSGEASGVNNTLRQVGATLGAAIIGAAVLTSLSTHLVAGVKGSPVIPETAKSQIIQTVSNPNSNVEFGSGAAVAPGTPQIISQEMQQLVNESATQATKDAYVYSALFAFLCLVASMFLPKTNIHDEQAAANVDHSKGKFVWAGALVVLSVIGAGLLLKQSSKKVIATGLVNIDAIRNVFTPPQNNIPNNPPPVQTPVASSTVDVGIINPRGSGGANVAPSSTPPTQPVVVPPQPIIYKNPSLGFQMEISNAWQATESGDGQTVGFINAQGQNISVQVYPADGQDLNEIKTQLQNSPSVTGVTNTSFKGEPALIFQMSSPNTTGLAIIHNNKLYYIMGRSSNEEPLNSFLFL